MPTASFYYSKKAIRQMNRTNLSMLIHLAAACFVCLFFFFFPMHSALTFKASIFLYTLLAVSAIYYGQHRLLHDQLRHQRVILDHESIQRQDGRYFEKLRYSFIDSVKVIEEADGELQSIFLYSRYGCLKLYGLENMALLLDLLQSRVNALVLVERKRLRISWKHNWLFHILLLCIAAGYLIVYYYAAEALLWVYPLLWFLQALYMLKSRPFSSLFGFRYWKWEVLASLVLLALSFWFLI